LNGCDEAIPCARQRFDIAGILGGVAESNAETIRRCVEPLLEIDEDVGRPQALPQFFPGYELAWPFEQGLEHLKRFALQLQPDSVFAQLTPA
jgi:hypothetical protein